MKQSRKQNILVLGHPLVVDANRSVWNELGAIDQFEVDLIVPKTWESNLIKKLHYSYNKETDNYINKIFTLTAFFKGNGSLTFFNPISLWLILNTKKYDRIIVTQETWSLSLLMTTFVSLFSRNLLTPLALWVCQNIKKLHLSWIIPFERINCLKVDKILCCCGEIEEVIQWKKISSSCLYFPFSFSANQYHSLRPIESEREIFKLGYIGRLSDEKGMALIESLFEKLKGLNIPCELHIAGSGPWQEKWQQLANSSKDSPQKVIFHGVLKHSEAYQFYEKIHATLLPSLTMPFWKEQFGRVIIESSASGRAVIGSSSGAIPEVMSLIKMPYNFKENEIDDLLEKTLLCRDHFLSGELDNKIEESKRLAFEKFDHKSVAQRASHYIQNPDDSYGIIKDSKISE